MNTKHELNQLNRIEEFAPIFTVNDHKIYFLIKRIFDLAITLSALIILLPIILLISILIALDSEGPIFLFKKGLAQNGNIIKAMFIGNLPDSIALNFEQ